jgi:hypothetical protein
MSRKEFFNELKGLDDLFIELDFEDERNTVLNEENCIPTNVDFHYVPFIDLPIMEPKEVTKPTKADIITFLPNVIYMNKDKELSLSCLQGLVKCCKLFEAHHKVNSEGFLQIFCLGHAEKVRRMLEMMVSYKEDKEKLIILMRCFARLGKLPQLPKPVWNLILKAMGFERNFLFSKFGEHICVYNSKKRSFEGDSTENYDKYMDKLNETLSTKSYYTDKDEKGRKISFNWKRTKFEAGKVYGSCDNNHYYEVEEISPTNDNKIIEYDDCNIDISHMFCSSADYFAAYKVCFEPQICLGPSRYLFERITWKEHEESGKLDFYLDQILEFLWRLMHNMEAFTRESRKTLEWEELSELDIISYYHYKGYNYIIVALPHEEEIHQDSLYPQLDFTRFIQIVIDNDVYCVETIEPINSEIKSGIQHFLFNKKNVVYVLNKDECF